MSNGSPKVYVIKPPANKTPPLPDAPSETSDQRSSKSESKSRSGRTPGRQVRQVSLRESSRALVMAYLAGPVTISRWFSGRRQLLWSLAGGLSVLAGFMLLALHSRFDAWVETTSDGLLWWLVIVPALVLAIGLIWARSVAAAGQMYPVPFSRLSRRLRSPGAIAAAGALVPGLGLMMSGRPRQAGWAFALLAPIAAAGIILARWHWLWDRGRTPVPAGISGPGLENLLVYTVAIAAGAAFVWLVQALDCARRVSKTRSFAVTDAASLGLLATLAVFAFAFHPTSVAQNFHAAAVTLRLDGYRLIPLGLNEAATWLDPGAPAYLAETADLYESLGMWEKSRQRRQLLEKRANEYARLAFGEGQTAYAPAGPRLSPYVAEQLSPYNQLPNLGGATH